MEFVKKCKKRIMWGSSKRSMHNGSGSYGRLSSEKKKEKKVPPQGCFWVYVGPERERFVMKIETLKHPSIKSLLEAAAKEYGYRNDGPLWLPSDVDVFCEALAEIEAQT